MVAESRGICTGMPLHGASRPSDLGLLAVLADLEREAEGLALDQRAAEAAELAVAEYAGVTWSARLLGAIGQEVRLHLVGGLFLAGHVRRAGEDWLVVQGQRTCLVPAHAVVTVEGLPDRAVAPEARTVLARLGFASVLRRLAAEHTACVVQLAEGARVEGRIRRVGADFVELDGPRLTLVPFRAISAVQESP